MTVIHPDIVCYGWCRVCITVPKSPSTLLWNAVFSVCEQCNVIWMELIYWLSPYCSMTMECCRRNIDRLSFLLHLPKGCFYLRRHEDIISDWLLFFLFFLFSEVLHIDQTPISSLSFCLDLLCSRSVCLSSRLSVLISVVPFSVLITCSLVPLVSPGTYTSFLQEVLVGSVVHVVVW